MAYKKIKELQQKEYDNKNEYWKNQPELKDSEFIQYLQNVEKQGKKIMAFEELCKYRINKKIPKSLPFEERKRLFCASDEWKSHIFQTNKHLEEKDLTEENIQFEINQAGILMGISLETSLGTNWAHYSTFDAECEVILDKGDIKYEMQE